MTRLTTRAKTTLWAGSGAFLGLAVGVALMDADVLGVLLIPWAFLFALFLGAVLILGREKGPQKARPAAARHAAASAVPERARPLVVRVGFPDVPEGYPPVLGVEDPLHVHVTVDWKEGPDAPAGAPSRSGGFVAAEGAAVRLSGRLRDGARFLAGEGVAGLDGTITFHVKPKTAGEVIFEAEAVLGDVKGAGEASVSLVRYDEEIERLFAEFRQYAHDALGPDSKADTARELAEKLRASASPQVSRALLELARVYELVVYGDRDADRTLYLALVGALLQLQKEA